MVRAKANDFDLPTERSLKEDPWVARIADHNWLREGVRLAYGRDLFASGGLDNGSERLLRVLAKPDSILLGEPNRKLRVLDIGCGAGALGITIARGLGAERVEVVLSDRDQMAVRFARINARLNRVHDGSTGDVKVLPAGLGYDPVLAAGEAPFDVVVANVPASAGDNGLYDLVYGAGRLLAKGGRVAIVYVAPLDTTMTAMREYHAKTYGEVVVETESRGKEHIVQVLRFPGGLPEFESDDPLASWRRDDAKPTIGFMGIDGVPWNSVHDVPEFDTPHFESELISRLIEEVKPAEARADAEEILVVNPRHGMLACALTDRRHPRRVALLSRDTLEVAVSILNVNSFLTAQRREHETTVCEAASWDDRPWLPNRAADMPRYHLIAAHLNWKEGLDALAVHLRALTAVLRDEGIIVVACRSGQIEGLRHAAHSAGLSDGRTHTRKGNTALVLKPRRVRSHPQAGPDEPEVPPACST